MMGERFNAWDAPERPPAASDHAFGWRACGRPWFRLTAWATPDGWPYTAVHELYGRLVSSGGDEWKDACEARGILARPLQDRASYMRMAARRRSGGDDLRQARTLAAMESAVMAEWKWRKAQRDAQVAA